MPGAVNYEEMLAGFGSATYAELRPAQRAVLTSYTANFADAGDVGVELPTGGGKSLIALLVAEAWRRQGKRAVVLSANKSLATQMEAHGRLLGVDVARLEGPAQEIPSSLVRQVNRGRTVGVMNYWVYFNQNPVLDPADLLVLDDVHLADGALQSLFSVEITRRAHPDLFSRLADLLGRRLPAYPGVRDAANATADPLSPTDLLAPHDHLEVIEQISAMIDGYAPTGDLGFRWSRARTQADAMHLYVTADQMVLRPYVWPLQELTHYRESTQRLYLSATLGSADDLQRRLGCHPVTLIDVDASSAEPLGRRMLVLNERPEEEHADAAVAATLAISDKGLWMTRSHASAAAEEQRLLATGHTPVWQLSRDDAEAARFAAADAGQLVCAGRYDGIDLPGDACRLVVITDLPRAVDLQEEFLSEQLRDASFLLERLNARILQALGRANRSPEDFAVYVLADQRLAAHLRRDTNRASLPARINAEIDVAQDLAAESAATVAQRTTAFVTRDFTFFDASVADAASAGPPVAAAAATVSAADEVEAWRRMHVGDFSGAAESFAAWVSACQSVGLRELAAFALVCQARACLLAARGGDAAAERQALDLLERAVGAGGLRSSWFNRLRSCLLTAQQTTAPAAGEAADAILSHFDVRAIADGGNLPKFERLRTKTTDQLATGTHAEFQEGMETLGRLLGMDAIRPRGTGVTDTRWSWAQAGGRHMLVCEAKIEHVEHNALSVADVDQANGQLTAARAEYSPQGFTCRGAIFSHLSPDPTAAGRLGDVRIVTRDAVVALWETVAGVYATYLNSWHPDSADARRAAIGAVQGQLPPDGWLTAALDGAVTLGPAEILAGWP